MADSNQLKRADHSEFLDNDPFAELTRLMGTPQPGQQSTADDLSLDLEKELLGDFSFEEFEAGQPAVAPETGQHWRQVTEAHAVDASGTQVEAQPDPPEMSDLTSKPPYEEAGSDNVALAPHGLDGIDLSLDEDFGADLEAELAPEPTQFAKDLEIAAEEPVSNLEQWSAEPRDRVPEGDMGAGLTASSAPEPTTNAAPEATNFAPALDIAAEELNADLEQWAAESRTWTPEENQPVDEPSSLNSWQDRTEPQDQAEPAAAVQVPQATDPFAEEFLAAVDMDFGLTADELAVEESPSETAEANWMREASGEAPDSTNALEDEPQSTPEPEADFSPAAETKAVSELSLEDELQALLADDNVATGGEEIVTDGAQDFEPVAEVPSEDIDAQEPDWQPAVSTFGHGSFQPVEEPTPAADVAESAAAHNEADELDAVMFELEHAPDDLPFVIEPSQTEPAEQQSAQPTDPFAELKAVMGLGTAQSAVAAPSHDASASTVSRPAPLTEAPDIETIDFADASVPSTQHLDVPELQYDAAPAPQAPLDDLEAEFADTFGNLDMFGDLAPAASAQPAEMSDAAWDAPEFWDDAGPTDAASANMPADTHLASHQSSEQGDGFYYSDETFDDQFQDRAPRAAGEAGPPRRRGFLVAGLVAGVAVLGGAGVFAMSMFTGDGGEPVFIRADAEPLKVRPENPGGTVVPNQENEVYQRVAGGDLPDTPEQERLITTAEEPIDVTPAEEIAALAPAVSADPEPQVAQETPRTVVEENNSPAMDVKSEARIEPQVENVSASGDDQFIALAPRRVQTLIVRPDGTMVPREDVAPAVDSLPNAAGDAIVSTETALQQPGGLSGGAERSLQAGDAEGPKVVTPDRVDVVPSRRSAGASSQQSAAAAPAASAPVTQASAPAAAAATTSEWSMQIASQPTAEGAQATYQELARRYGDVLEGRGVNIVRADITGKGVYYRVRIPAANRDDAVDLCTRYKAGGGSCFVSR